MSGELRAKEDGPDRIRVVSLNCNVGQSRCVKEVAIWKPDIVLLQESPGPEQLEEVSHSLFSGGGCLVFGGDVAILTAGTVCSRPPQTEPHFVEARIELPNGASVDVISTRLAPPVFRLDFWTPGFWVEHRDRRIQHRDQVRAILRRLSRLPATERVIVGGDFNAPPDDGALRPLSERLVDSFRLAGHSWGNTGTNEYPLFRVDQIWVSDGLTPESSIAVRTQYSDHRLVVCDLVIRK
ncbi:hypothetical protein GC176_07980 [bacterium]|nr:hypothetical protein [bacterium]